MSSTQTTPKYDGLLIALHWLMALLMVGVYAAIELREWYPKGSDPREALKALHFMLGLSVLLLIGVRLYARLRNPAPAIVPTPPAWQARAAGIAHGLLYAMMILMPLGGWLMLSAAGKPIPFFGLELPALIGQNKELAGTIKEIHKTVGTLGYALIGLHVIAAIYHHHIVKDNTLLRMMPHRRQHAD